MQLLKPPWFAQTELAIGKSKAIVELTKAINSPGYTGELFEDGTVNELLHWKYTPQGFDFWNDIQKYNPSLKNQLKLRKGLYGS